MTHGPKPLTAYESLDPIERAAVDDYVMWAVGVQKAKRQRIAFALNYPIPEEWLRRSRGVLTRPLPLAAVHQRIQAAAEEQDLSPDRIINEHFVLAFSSLEDIMQPGRFGPDVKPFNEIDPVKLRAVKSIKVKAGMYGISTEVVMHDKSASLATLEKLTGLVAPDRPPILKEYVTPPKTVEELSQRGNEESYAALLEDLRGAE